MSSLRKWNGKRSGYAATLGLIALSACEQQPGTTASGSSTSGAAETSSASGVTPVKAAGLALVGTTLIEVTDANQLAPALAQPVPVQNFSIAPSNMVYIQPASGQQMIGGVACSLGQLNPSTGTTQCLDSNALPVDWLSQGTNAPVQSGANGILYYLTKAQGANGLTSILNVNNGGQITQLLGGQGLNIKDFLVQPDGSVMLQGLLGGNGGNFLGQLLPNGQLQNLGTQNPMNMLSSLLGGIFGGSGMGGGFSAGGLLGMFSQLGGAQNGLGGFSQIFSMLNGFGLPTGNLFGGMNGFAGMLGQFGGLSGFGGPLAGLLNNTQSLGNINSLMGQFMPASAGITNNFSSIAGTSGVLQNLLFSGRNTNGGNLLALLNPATNQAYSLPFANQFNIGSLAGSNSATNVLFSGTQNSSGAQGIGIMNLSNLLSTFLPIAGPVSSIAMFR